MQTITKFILLISLASFTLTSMAANTEQLSAAIINQWMASQKSLEAWGEKHESTLAKYEDQTNARSPMDLSPESLIAPIKASGLYEKANRLVQKHGFKSIDSWASITLRITKAVAAVEFSKQPELTDTSELEELLQSPQISPEHKALISEAIKQNKMMVEQIKNGSNSEDMEAVKKLLPEILKFMDDSPTP